MDAVNLTILVHALGMCVLIVGGVAALYFGYVVIRSGTSDPATATFKFLGLNATAKGAGAVIMATAVGWAYCGVRIAPNLATDGTGTKVYSFQTSEGRVTAPAFLAAPLDAGDRKGVLSYRSNLIDDTALVRNFEDSVLVHQATFGSLYTGTIHGSPAKIIPASTVIKLEGDKALFSVLLKSEDKLAKVTFTEAKRGDHIFFIPYAVESFDNTNLEHKP
jgi:hypothetical protein